MFYALFYKKAALSQWELRDAAVSFDTYLILHYNGIIYAVSCHSIEVTNTRKNQSDRIFNADKYCILITLN